MNNSNVNGFLDVKGRKIVNEVGEEVILTGWGLGNWLLCEGYMWMSYGNERFDRPRRIEAVIEELTGAEYARSFWHTFRENYITEDDIRYMAELGYNSVRIPLNARLFLQEGPGFNWVEEGFLLLDRCLDWCEKYKLYAFLDLHGAPGGQTGANIDDCIDDLPRLFLDQDCFDKGIALWKKLAMRYKDRWIVGGYDLLNEPIRPKRSKDDTDLDYLVPRLIEFYEKCIAEIRKIDTKHIFSLEGHHWATATDVFCKKYDPKMVIHFHRYACMPDIKCYQQFLALSEKWDCPLWLGETGENITEWFSAMYPLAAELGIGYNVWPYKKMNCMNSPCSINHPDDWEKIIDYTKKGLHPGYETAQKILDEYLENIKLDNCINNKAVTKAVLRQPGCTMRGTDFDEFPGKGVSYFSVADAENTYQYRTDTGMKIVLKHPELERKFGFDCGFTRYVLALYENEFAVYTLNNVIEVSKATIRFYCSKKSIVNIYQENRLIVSQSVDAQDGIQMIEDLRLLPAEKTAIKIKVVQGSIEIEDIKTI